MKKILAIGGSNSKTSINKQFANHIANQIAGTVVTTADIHAMKLPLFGVDVQKEIGIPQAAKDFLQQITDADAIVLSVAEHNGLITAAFKNLWDWTSRLEQKLWMNKPMFLASTSPGGRGAQSAFESTQKVLPHYGGNVVARMSFPLFHDNLQDGTVQDEELRDLLAEQISLFTQAQ